MKIVFELDKIKKNPIAELYSQVCIALGEVETDDTRYDCNKISVAKDLFDICQEWYRQRNADMTFGMDWVCYGPKCDDTLPDHEVDVKEGFIHNV